MLTVRNPYTSAVLATLPFATPHDLHESLDRASQAFAKWRHSSSWERAQLLIHVASQLESRRQEFAELIRDEAGKPISYAVAEVDRALGVLRWAAAESQRFGGELLRLDTNATGRQGFGIHTRFPRGVVLGITPFNFPLNLAVHKIAPAIACGCAIILKPSPATPLVVQRFASFFDAVPGLVEVVLPDDAGAILLTQARECAMISFTGSAHVGWSIRRQAPEKPVTLELGGNAWVIVLEDIPAALYPGIARRIANGAFGYAGQSCISVQNVAVASPIWQPFKAALSRATEETRFGDPRIADVISGPSINPQAAGRIHSELGKITADSERIVSRARQGEAVAGVVPPNLVLMPELGPPGQDIPVVQEEIFGPVMTARSFSSMPDLIQQINSSRYGLQAGVYTQNLAAIEQFYRELNVGGLVVNEVPTTRYDHQPYGGVKDSGEGREGVRYAMDEMTVSKWLALSSQVVI
ncbi:MAG: aldehyde dehydrogenase family protein [Pseudomonadota bacterium]